MKKRKGLKRVIIVEDIAQDYICNTNNLNKTRLTNGELKIYYEGIECATKYWEKQKNKYNKIETEINSAKTFYKAEEYQQQYIEKQGRFSIRNLIKKLSK